MKRFVYYIASVCILIAGCNNDRVAKLEKANQDLQAKLSREDTLAAYDLSAKCAKDARTWFNENWSWNKDTVLLTFSNHYNKRQNKCFILTEFHYNSHFAGSLGDTWTNDMSLTNVYENDTIGKFGENHTFYFKHAVSRTEVISCAVNGQQCKSLDEFDNLVAPYMND